MSLLKAEDITVRDGRTTLLAPLSLSLEPGEPLVVLGETGSGKSLMAQALMGTLPPELQATGHVALGNRELNAGDPDRFRGLWGREIGVLPQEPWLSLDPLMRVDRQVAEAHALVRGLSRRDALARASVDLDALGLSGAGASYPHQLSGGMAQRVAIAAARAGGARIVIADEPTKGLDAARRDDVANLLLTEMGETGGILVITHDLALSCRIGGRLIVLRAGAVVERGTTREIFAAPRAAYTKELFAADPENWTPRRQRAATGATVIGAKDLSVARAGRTLFSGLSFEIPAGGILGVTGPSGCGKSSLGDALLGLVAPAQGTVARTPEAHPFAFQKLYQDPVAAFPRKRSLGKTLQDMQGLIKGQQPKIETLLDALGLDPRLLARRPGAVSGGELQRFALLRILLRQPRFVFADEPTSRLDPITQAKVIELLVRTAVQDNVALMLVSHDPALIRNTGDAVLSLDPASPPVGGELAETTPAASFGVA